MEEAKLIPCSSSNEKYNFDMSCDRMTHLFGCFNKLHGPFNNPLYIWVYFKIGWYQFCIMILSCEDMFARVITTLHFHVMLQNIKRIRCSWSCRHNHILCPEISIPYIYIYMWMDGNEHTTYAVTNKRTGSVHRSKISLKLRQMNI